MRHGRHNLATRRGLMLALLPVSAWGQPQVKQPVRLLVSSAVMGLVNESDARAALWVWAGAITKWRNLEIPKGGVRIAATAELEELVKTGQADAIGMTVHEYARLAPYLWHNQVLVEEGHLKGESTYQILVHADSDIRKLADLKGRSMTIWTNPKMNLAEEWLATLLAGDRLAAPEQLLGKLSRAAKVSGGAALPVYFRQQDACLVTTQAFEDLCELNPQLRKKLRVLAASPLLVTNLFAFHKNFSKSGRDLVTEALVEAHKSEVGRQALTLFQGRKIVSTGPEVFSSALAQLRRYEQLKGGAVGGRR